MQLLSNKVIYHNGQHNAFTSMVRWKDKYWVAFRHGATHKSHDGQIMVMSSADLETWSEPQAVINTSIDDRDPTVFICNEQLFVNSMSKLHEGEKERRLVSMSSFIVSSSDGVNWTEPQLALPEHRAIWWVAPGPDALYASVYGAGRGDGVRADSPNYCKWTELWRSEDGLAWEKVGIISDENRAGEAALAFLPDKRLFAFVRHDEHDKPEIKFASPPYTEWETAVELGFRNNGPSIGLVGDKLVTATRAHFEDPRTPLADDLCRERLRGMILGVFDPDTLEWEPALTIPHSRGVALPTDPDGHTDEAMNWPDVSYASIMDLGDGKFVMIYYEGLKGPPSDIRAAMLTM